MTSEIALPSGALAEIWQEAQRRLRAQLEQRTPEAVFLEGSLAEGFGNERSDIDFVALVDDGTKVATMPYVLFIRERRVEVRLLSRKRILRELKELCEEVDRGLPLASSAISWNKLERCQRFMHCHPIHNPVYIGELQRVLGIERLGLIVSTWFADFARETGRYAVAMHALGQPLVARAWLKTAVFHAAKSYVARRGEHYLGSKWLALQLERCGVDAERQQRLREVLFGTGTYGGVSELKLGLDLLNQFGVDGVPFDEERILVGARQGVSTWQIGRQVHVVRSQDMFALGERAAKAWRSIVFGKSCLEIAGAIRGTPEAGRRRRTYLAEFARVGLIGLLWDGSGEIRVRQTGESRPLCRQGGPLLGASGAQILEGEDSEVQLLPMPAVRFAEAGVNLTWGNIGVENALEDSLGALKKGQWGVLEYTLARMIQAAALVAIAAHGITPQPALEEATLVATRVLCLPESLVSMILRVEQTPVTSASQAQEQFDLASEVVRSLRRLAGDESFPASLENAEGWCEPLLYG